MSHNKNGVLFCAGQFSTNAFCITKLVQLIMSSILLCFILYDMIRRYLRERTFISLFFGLCSLMTLALVCNIAYCLNHQLYGFNYLEGFFYNNYFVVIVYYVALRLFKAMRSQKFYFWIAHTIFGIFIVFSIYVLIENFIVTYSRCNQLWYLVVDGLSIILSLVLTFLGYTFTQRQIQRISGIDNPIHYKNPLPNIWLWISANIFSQIASFTEDLVFQIRRDLNCSFSQNFTVDRVIKLIFVFLSFQLGMISTLVFFRMKYKREKENQNISETDDSSVFRRASMNIELIQQFARTS